MSVFLGFARRAVAAALSDLPPKRLLVAYGLLLVTLAAWSALAAVFDRLPGDVAITRAVQDIDLPALRSAMRFSTNMTSPVYSGLTMVTIVLALLLIRQPRLALFTIGALGAHAIGGVLKLLVDRPGRTRTLSARCGSRRICRTPAAMSSGPSPSKAFACSRSFS